MKDNLKMNSKKAMVSTSGLIIENIKVGGIKESSMV
jgi:hypothetical protein